MAEHLTAKQLADAAAGLVLGEVASAHLGHCVQCRIAIRRVGDIPFDPPSRTALDALTQAGPVLSPGLISTMNTDSRASGRQPQVNEVWRVSGDEGLLVFVRRIVSAQTIDAVPITLDVEMADAGALLLPANATPLQVPVAVFADLHSHLPATVFVSWIADLDGLGENVEVLLSGTGATSQYLSGDPIATEFDARLEYRAELKETLATLASYIGDQSWSALDRRETGHRVAAMTRDRIPGAYVRTVDLPVAHFDASGSEVRPLNTVSYLGTAVVVCHVVGFDELFDHPSTLVPACRRVTSEFPDVDAIALFREPSPWPALLFNLADLNDALRVPSGRTQPPAPTLTGMGLIDTLFKHLDGDSSVPWITPSGDHGGEGLMASMPALARTVATEITSDMARQSAGYRVTGKREGYARAVQQVDWISDFVGRLSDGDVQGALEVLRTEAEQ